MSSSSETEDSNSDSSSFCEDESNDTFETVSKKIIKLDFRICLNESLKTGSTYEALQTSWKEEISQKNENFETIANPFQVVILNDFISNELVLDQLKNECNKIKWNSRKLDLYEFYQSVDLKKIKKEFLRNFYEFLDSDIKEWMSQLTGLNLVRTSATCSLYRNNDHLLVHDDHQEDRLIAFIFYLTETPSVKFWTPEMGGALQLFSHDENGQPTQPVKEIYPKNNQFVFFRVSDYSYHQVDEVINDKHGRLSINGWFHTTSPVKFKELKVPKPIKGIFSDDRRYPQKVRVNLKEWVFSDYLKENIQKQIQDTMEESSEISLAEFLLEDKFKSICSDLEASDITWNWMSPPNRYRYEIAKEETLSGSLKDVVHLLQSEEMFSFLKLITDLDLNSVRLEVQRWTPGCYSLLSDHQWSSESELDLLIFFALNESKELVGGNVVYVASDEEQIEDALIDITPKNNFLNIIYRDTARFVKYISKTSSLKQFFAIFCSYKE